jgi:ATP phosphoribosyltransferase
MTNTILALPSKGAIAEPTIDFLRDCGLRVEKSNPRQYTGTVKGIADLSVLFQRVTDVLYKVNDGTVHMGVTGLDIVQEHPLDDIVIIHESLGYGYCELVVAVPESWVDVDSFSDLVDIASDFRAKYNRNIRVATKYPLLTRKFFHSHGLHHFTLVNSEGAIEAGPMIGYADFIVDLSQTGTTLRENHLKIVPDGIIMTSQACLIGNRHLLQGNPEVLTTVRNLTELIDASVNARGYYQVTANIQGNDPALIASKVAMSPITHGLQGPTLARTYVPDHGNDWYTLTVIIPSRDVLGAVDHIRSIGGTQTIITPVRYVFWESSQTFTRLREKLALY